MKFAVFTATLPDLSPSEALREIAAQGWDGVEWRVTDQADSPTPGFWAGNRCTWPLSTFLTDAGRIGEMTRRHGLAMPSLGTYVSWADLDQVEIAMRGAALLGIPQIRVRAHGPGSDGYRASFERARAGYLAVAELAEHHGVRALVETHPGDLVASCSAAVRFLQGCDPQWVGVIHNAGNMAREGHENLAWSIEMLGEYLAHVHVKNAVPREVVADGSGQPRWQWEWAALKDGIVHLPELFESLGRVGYSGWITVANFSTGTPTTVRMAADLAYMRELAGSVVTPVESTEG